MWSCTFKVRKHLVRRAFKSSYTSLEDEVTGPINYIYELYIHIQFILLCIKGGGGTHLYRVSYTVHVYIGLCTCTYTYYTTEKKLLSFTEQRTVSPVHIELDVSNNQLIIATHHDRVYFLILR